MINTLKNLIFKSKRKQLKLNKNFKIILFFQKKNKKRKNDLVRFVCVLEKYSLITNMINDRFLNK